MGKHIKIIIGPFLTKAIDGRGCGECQTSCQSACKTSITVSNQTCLKKKNK